MIKLIDKFFFSKTGWNNLFLPLPMNTVLKISEWFITPLITSFQKKKPSKEKKRSFRSFGTNLTQRCNEKNNIAFSVFSSRATEKHSQKKRKMCFINFQNLFFPMFVGFSYGTSSLNKLFRKNELERKSSWKMRKTRKTRESAQISKTALTANENVSQQSGFCSVCLFFSSHVSYSI